MLSCWHVVITFISSQFAKRIFLSVAKALVRVVLSEAVSDRWIDRTVGSSLQNCKQICKLYFTTHV